jgi:hypothetical protein
LLLMEVDAPSFPLTYKRAYFSANTALTRAQDRVTATTLRTTAPTATDRRDLTHHWETYPFGIGSWRRARNVVLGSLHGRSITAFEYHYVFLTDDTTERDAFRNFLVCVVDLDHAVPPLTAVRRDRLIWHGGQLVGTEIPIGHKMWRDQYILFGKDSDFARRVVTEEHAARCAEIDIKTEWRFVADVFLLWIENARVDDTLPAALEVLRPLISAAEGFSPTGERQG